MAMGNFLLWNIWYSMIVYHETFRVPIFSLTGWFELSLMQFFSGCFGAHNAHCNIFFSFRAANNRELAWFAFRKRMVYEGWSCLVVGYGIATGKCLISCLILPNFCLILQSRFFSSEMPSEIAPRPRRRECSFPTVAAMAALSQSANIAKSVYAKLGKIRQKLGKN